MDYSFVARACQYFTSASETADTEPFEQLPAEDLPEEIPI